MKHLALLCSAIVFVLLPAALAAQNSGPVHSESWYVTVKPSHAADFEAAIQKHGALRREKGDPRNWTILTPVTGDNVGIYLIRTCCYSWQEIDQHTAWEARNPSVIGDWSENVAPYVANLGHYFYESDRANSHWPEDSAAPNFVGVTQYYIKSGEEDAFHSARHKLSQIALNHGWARDGRRWSWYTRVGGKPQVVIGVPYDSYSDMAPDDESFFNFLARILGADGAAALLDETRAATHGSKYTIWQRRSDLSSADD